jgi:hypothetical protein
VVYGLILTTVDIPNDEHSLIDKINRKKQKVNNHPQNLAPSKDG